MLRRTVQRLSKTEVLAIQNEVRRRDQGRCLICGQSGAHVHEMLQKSKSISRAAKVFRKKYMGCLCEYHHLVCVHASGRDMKLWITAKMILVMHERYSYTYPTRLMLFVRRRIAKGQPNE